MFTSNLQQGTLNRNTVPQFYFLNLIDTAKLVKNKLKLYTKVDSIERTETLDLKFVKPYLAEVVNKLQEGVNYKIKMDTAAIYDYHGKFNDSIELKFKLNSKSDYGRVILKLLMSKKQNYVVQLLNENETLVQERFISFSLSSSNSANIDMDGILPGKYLVKVIFDDNENKKWDTGNYLKRIQAEKVFFAPKQLLVTADWELEEEILVK